MRTKKPAAPGAPPVALSADLDGFAARNLPMLEQVFLRFYTSYDQYRADLTAWQAKYTVPGSTPAPGPVVIQLPSSSVQSQAQAQAR